MKKIATIILGSILLISCENLEENNSEMQKRVGNDKDKHGCIASAGYSWSELNQDCIRLFEVGMRLTSIDEGSEKIVYLIFNEDESKVEVFMPDSKSTHVLPLLEDGKYGFENLEYDKSDSSLSIDGVKKFELESK